MSGIKTALVAFAVASTLSSAASAGITRTSNGNYRWNSVNIVTETGAHLQTIAPTDATLVSHYATAVGYHGGRDSAANRIEAKRRANALAEGCLFAFMLYPTSDQRFHDKCNIASTVWVNPVFQSVTNFNAFVQGRWCPAARQAAVARGIAGPVFLNVDVGFFLDAAGTEADRQQHVGPVSMLPCF